jgi:hypothetical protein
MNSQGERLAMETYLKRARKVRENQCLHLGRTGFKQRCGEYMGTLFLLGSGDKKRSVLISICVQFCTDSPLGDSL